MRIFFFHWMKMSLFQTGVFWKKKAPNYKKTAHILFLFYFFLSGMVINQTQLDTAGLVLYVSIPLWYVYVPKSANGPAVFCLFSSFQSLVLILRWNVFNVFHIPWLMEGDTLDSRRLKGKRCKLSEEMKDEFRILAFYLQCLAVSPMCLTWTSACDFTLNLILTNTNCALTSAVFIRSFFTQFLYSTETNIWDNVSFSIDILNTNMHVFAWIDVYHPHLLFLRLFAAKFYFWICF